MRMASRTISEASMKTCEAASAVPSPTTAMPPQVMPLRSSSQTNLRRHLSTFTSLCGSARNWRQAAIMKNLAEMTVASHAEAWITGAQNIEASEKITASSGRVTRADSSLRTSMASSSYSNSGFRTVLCASLARMSRRLACMAARGSFARRRCWEAGLSSTRCILSLAVPRTHVHFPRDVARQRCRPIPTSSPAGAMSVQITKFAFINGLRLCLLCRTEARDSSLASPPPDVLLPRGAACTANRPPLRLDAQVKARSERQA